MNEVSRSEVDATKGPLILEFGSANCGWCLAAQPLLRAAVAAHPGLTHLKVEDARGQPLGRSFGVKLWPTLVILKDGHEIARVVRPASVDELNAALGLLYVGPSDAR